MIRAIICARSIHQARAFARDVLSISEIALLARNAAIVTRDEMSGGANSCVRGLLVSAPFYVIGGAETERNCEETITYLTAKGHTRGTIPPEWAT